MLVIASSNLALSLPSPLTLTHTARVRAVQIDEGEQEIPSA